MCNFDQNIRIPLDEKINLNSSSYKSTSSQSSSRRSKNALNKISKMKKNYMQVRSESLTTDGDMVTVNSEHISESFKTPDELNDDFEDEVKDLYMWTQNLSTNDDYLGESRLQEYN